MSLSSAESSDRPACMPVRSILLCGSSVRSLAESAIAAGLRPLCVDFFEDADLTQLLSHGRGRFVGRINSFADLPRVTQSVRHSIPMLWAGGLENHTDVLRAIARRRRLIGADPDIVDQVRDPVTLHSWLTEAGLSVPRLATESTADADCQWLRKPLASSGGLGIHRHEQPGASKRRIRTPESEAGDRDALPTHRIPSANQYQEYLQEYIDGVPMSAVFSVVKGQMRLHGMSLQLTGWPSLGASDFLFCGNIGPVDPGDGVTRQVLMAAETIVSLTGMTGVFGIDFILRKGLAWFLEVNPRLTASHMLYEQQNPGLLVREQLAAFGLTAGRRPEVPGTAAECQTVTARFILWAHTELIVPDKFESLFGQPANAGVRRADLPKTGALILQGSPICSVIVTAGNTVAIADVLGAPCLQGVAAIVPSWQSVGEQIRLLERRFQRNI